MESQNEMKQFRLEETDRIESGFTPDENYFENMQREVMQTIGAKTRVIPLYRRPWFSMAAAIMVIALFLTLTFTYEFQTADQSDEISSIENYLTYSAPISQYEIAGQLTDADIDMLEAELLSGNYSQENVLSESPDVEYYLINQIQ